LNSPKSLLEYFYEWENKLADAVFLKQPLGKNWKTYTWREAGQSARKMANFLKAQNLPAESKIGILSKNCAHWILCDLAIMMSGHVSTPFYPNTAKKELAYVLDHSDCKFLFLGKLDEWDERKTAVPKAVKTIAFPHYEGNAIVEADYYWDTLCKTNEPLTDNYIPNLDNLFTIIYTSGTTGNPKGVMHTWHSTAAMLQGELEFDNLKTDGKPPRLFSYLPLNHIAERIFVEATSLFRGGTISFAESIDTFAENLADVQPTHFIAVPRIWTKFQMAIIEKLGEKKINLFLKTPLMNRLIKRSIKKKLGLSKAKLVLTGAAPMAAETIAWYQKFDIHIQEVYAMTENNGGCALMPADAIKSGTVGKPIGGVEIKIDETTGEVLMKAPWNMSGYYKDIKKSDIALKDGWLHTGDMGTIDAHGYLTLTGRLSDTFKSTKGKFIVPAPLERAFAVNTDVEQVCVTGSHLSQPVALCLLSEIGLQKDKTEVEAGIAENLEETNNGQPNYSKLAKVILLKETWSAENDMLTTTLKIKRNKIYQHYKEKLEPWYNSKGLIVWGD